MKAVVHIPGQPPRDESFTLRKRHLESHPRVLPPGLGPTAVRLGPAFLLLGLANLFSEVLSPWPWFWS
jgi:hypothetical protein